MEFLRAEVSKLQETALFDSLPGLASTLAQSSTTTDSRTRRRGVAPVTLGGGGIQGPSAEDAVDIDRLLEEMTAPPSSSSRPNA